METKLEVVTADVHCEAGHEYLLAYPLAQAARMQTILASGQLRCDKCGATLHEGVVGAKPVKREVEVIVHAD